MEIESIIKETVKILRKYLSGEYQIFLFGSFVKGNALPSSDIDIGILGKEKIPWSIMTKILEEIDSIKTLRKIDLVDFFTKEETFKKNALKSARKLYE
jgi:predicted nucleotidyltransferase